MYLHNESLETVDQKHEAIQSDIGQKISRQPEIGLTTNFSIVVYPSDR
jgi:hypothetical protein